MLLTLALLFLLLLFFIIIFIILFKSGCFWHQHCRRGCCIRVRIINYYTSCVSNIQWLKIASNCIKLHQIAKGCVSIITDQASPIFNNSKSLKTTSNCTKLQQITQNYIKLHAPNCNMVQKGAYQLLHIWHLQIIFNDSKLQLLHIWMFFCFLESPIFNRLKLLQKTHQLFHSRYMF